MQKRMNTTHFLPQHERKNFFVCMINLVRSVATLLFKYHAILNHSGLRHASLDAQVCGMTHALGGLSIMLRHTSFEHTNSVSKINL